MNVAKALPVPVTTGLRSEGMNEPAYPVLATCPVKERPVKIGHSVTRGDDLASLLVTNSRFVCSACGLEHVIEEDQVVLADTPD
jgi:hypothetical protein